MPVTVNCETEKGGSVTFNEAHSVWASYAVAAVGDSPPPETLHVGIDLACGRHLHLFVNRETGLVVVESPDPKGGGGVELLRTHVGRPRPDGRRYRLEPLEAEAANRET